MKRFGKEKHLQKLEHLTLQYGGVGIFIAAFSPIPYKVLGWMAGMGQMAKKPFIIAGFLGRSLRFGLEAILIGIYGEAALDAMMWFLDHEIILAVVCILGILVAWYAGSGGQTSKRRCVTEARAMKPFHGNGYEQDASGVTPYGMGQVHHYGFSSRRPGSNPGASTSDSMRGRHYSSSMVACDSTNHVVNETNARKAVRKSSTSSFMS